MRRKFRFRSVFEVQEALYKGLLKIGKPVHALGHKPEGRKYFLTQFTTQTGDITQRCDGPFGTLRTAIRNLPHDATRISLIWEDDAVGGMIYQEPKVV